MEAGRAPADPDWRVEVTAVLADHELWSDVRGMSSSEGQTLPEHASRGRQRQVRLPSDRQAQLVSEYADGATLEALASRFGVHTGTAAAILERNGTARRYRTLAGDTLKLAIELYESGLSLADVGARVGVHATTVHGALMP